MTGYFENLSYVELVTIINIITNFEMDQSNQTERTKHTNNTIKMLNFCGWVENFFCNNFLFCFITDLPNSSVHAVIAAQSFHWFANDKSISEIHRVLVPGGKLGLEWNTRDHSTPWVKELDEEIVLPLYKQSNTPHQQTGEWKKVLSASGKFGPIDSDESFKMDQTFNFDEFINRLMSISVIAVRSKEEKQIIIDKVKLILSKHNKQEKDTFTLPYSVQIYWCQRT